MTENDQPTGPDPETGAEQVILGALMERLADVDHVAGQLTERHFWRPRHAAIYRHILAARDAGQPADPIALAHRLAAAEDLHRVGGANYLHDCVAAAPIGLDVGHYIGIIREAAERRSLEEQAERLRYAAGIANPERRHQLVAEITGHLAGQQTAAAAGTAVFVDVAAVLDGGLPEAPPPTLLHRDDGHALFYAGKVNVLFGDPECGKTWIALAAIVEALQHGHRAAVIDLDHNGAVEIVSRLLVLGATPTMLRDPDRFRLVEPDDAEQLVTAVTALASWQPAAALVDSLGEVLPLLGLSSSSPDDYTIAHRKVLTPLAAAGAAVIAVDHLPKSDDARAHGQTGTLAKRRAVNGVSLRVTVSEAFAPGRGGAASMTVEKDRSGGVRAHCPDAGKRAPAGRFVMTAHDDGTTTWRVTTPRPTGGPGVVADDDLAELDGLVPPPKSKRDVQDRLGWGSDRAHRALSMWRDLRKPAA